MKTLLTLALLACLPGCNYLAQPNDPATREMMEGGPKTPDPDCKPVGAEVWQSSECCSNNADHGSNDEHWICCAEGEASCRT